KSVVSRDWVEACRKHRIAAGSSFFNRMARSIRLPAGETKACYEEDSKIRTVYATGDYPAACSKSSPCKSSDELKSEEHPWREYVEDFNEPRTKLANFYRTPLSSEELFGIARG